jgi:hypothetical protein
VADGDPSVGYCRVEFSDANGTLEEGTTPVERGIEDEPVPIGRIVVFDGVPDAPVLGGIVLLTGRVGTALDAVPTG